MVCSKFDELNHQEKISFIGRLVHATQSNNKLFEEANRIIEKAIMWGLFDGVVIIPPPVDN